MEILKDIYYTNLDVSKKALVSTIKNWSIIFTGLFYSVITIILSMSLRYFGILGGIVSIVVTSALISNYLYLLDTILKRGYFNFQDFKDGFTPYLSKIWSILFIGYVAKLILDFIAPTLTTFIAPGALGIIITFLTFMLFNPIPEITYQKHYGPGETIMYSVNFVRDNWVEWFIPNIVLLAVFYFLSGQSLSIFRIVNNVFNYFMSFTSISISVKGLLIYVLGQVWFSYFMIYRAYLFETLSTSSRRKRLFTRDF